MSGKAQISVEYMILTGFILLVVIIPSSYLVFSLANQGVYGTMNNQRSIDLGKGIVESAKQMYYLGLYSKKTVAYDVPTNVERMFVLMLEDTATSDRYFYFGIIINDEKTVMKQIFLSDVPISSEYNAYVDAADSDLYIPECTSGDFDCTYYNFIKPVTNPGQKQFRIETKYDNALSETVVHIVPIME
jgi:uncharacterized protein (UPF0333 family)